VSADEIKKTPDAEASAAPKKAAAKEAPATKAPAKKPAAKKAPAKKPAAKVAKPAASKPAAAKAGTAKKPSATTPAAVKPAAKKPGAKKAAAKPAAAAAKPAAAAAKKPAAKPAAAAAKPAAKKAAARPGAKAETTKAAARPVAAAPKAEKKPAAERPARQKAAKKAAPELRHGKAGVATVVDARGKEVETRDLDSALFAVPADINTLHLVVRAEQAAHRSGTASTKTRGEVSGSTAKLYRQKGTGRARAGSVKSPVRTGGGIAFGPRPRSFAFKVNRKVVRKALAMALSNRAENGNVYVASGLDLEVPSTATMNEFLVNLDIAAPVLIVTHDESTVSKSVRNLTYAEASEVAALSTEQVLRARSLVLTEKAFIALNEA
jgi:large subunit ribosomal protein L4